MLSPNRTPSFPFYSLLISGGHTILVRSTTLITHEIIINTRDIAAGDYLDKVARALQVPWGSQMPGAALETWSEINEVGPETSLDDVNRWNLPRPLSNDKQRVLAFSFTGLQTAVETETERGEKSGMKIEEKKSLGRAAQMLMFNHVVSKVALGLSMADEEHKGTLVVSGGVASNQSFLQAYGTLLLREIEMWALTTFRLNAGLKDNDLVFDIIAPPTAFCTVYSPLFLGSDVERIMLR
jgi:N6-L-threonylcarbamoyladenine synthase